MTHFHPLPKFLILFVINLSQKPGMLYKGPGVEDSYGLFVKSDFLPNPKLVFEEDLLTCFSFIE